MSYPEDMRGAADPDQSDPTAAPQEPDGSRPAREAVLPPADVRTERLPDDPLSHRQATRASQDEQDADVVDRFSGVHERTKLQLATALMSALTLLLAVIMLIALLAHVGDDEPVLVDGVPCLVQDGEGDQAVLYCQR